MESDLGDFKEILLVEDDLRDVELTLAALAEEHVADKVFVVHDGAAALDYLYRRGKYAQRAGGNPMVVLLDNKMPKVDGLEVLKTIKADEQLKVIPVVVLTSSLETAALAEFYHHGANAYVVKPVGFPEFMTAIKRLGIFWAVVNEPPPRTGKMAALDSSSIHFHGKNEVKNEVHAPHPAPRG
jgi:CheY-like chemotaxis protein